jgi:hypothetical protein
MKKAIYLFLSVVCVAAPAAKFPPAKVGVSGRIAGMTRKGETIEYRLSPPAGEDMLTKAMYLEVPAAKEPKRPTDRRLIAASGALEIGSALSGAMAGSHAGQAPVLWLKVDEFTIVDPEPSPAFPPEGMALVHGRVIKGKFLIQSGAVGTKDRPSAPVYGKWAIANAETPIVLTGASLEGQKIAQAETAAIGRLSVSPGGKALLLEVDGNLMQAPPAKKGK